MRDCLRKLKESLSKLYSDMNDPLIVPQNLEIIDKYGFSRFALVEDEKEPLKYDEK